MKIVSKNQIAKETVEMVLENDIISEQAKPGQFLHISVAGHTLRRPISIAHIDRQNKTVTILFKIIGSGTETLAKYQVGDYLDVLGPNGGNGFPTDLSQEESVLLIGGGIGVPPLYCLARELHQKGVKIQAILGFQSKEYMFYEEKFNDLGKTFIVTNDGSYGEKGLVTDMIEQVEDFDRYYSCGPLPMLRAVKETIHDKPGFLSFEERMACGIGACFSCVIHTDTETGYKKICQDGPVFAANEVML